MNIALLEERIEKLGDNNYASIIKLIITAVRNYPIYRLDDADTYFKEIKTRLNVEQITPEVINKYIKHDPKEGSENNIWTITSLGSLLEAFNLMQLYKMSLEEVLSKIKELS